MDIAIECGIRMGCMADSLKKAITDKLAGWNLEHF